MAISFSDLHTETGLKSLNEFLSGKTYISRYYSPVRCWSEDRWPGCSFGSSCCRETKKQEDAAQCYDFDLFGDETERKEGAAEREAAKLLRREKRNFSPDILGGKICSSGCKALDDETDMKKLEEAVRSVQMPGLSVGSM
ncbi:Elongation factor 1-beta 1 [Apostasia shenzhenica]|uniref:Elongation factor 1-beta 1 n=1 Tax=Apostasia shenzhenica TaxID=1088818 RepID=A0A2H9ZT94_9ASPA|nr:Elongation factor 1-beta 1 [Apostasia shenzhenica]